MDMDMDMDMDSLTTTTVLNHRALGHRDSTYSMLLQLVAADRAPECLTALHQMVTTPRVGCWRDVRGFIRHFEKHGGGGLIARYAAVLIAGCVHMTNAHIRMNCCCGSRSWAAKWVPREPKCRKSPLLQWYYDALAAEMFPGAPDAKRRYRKLIAALTPPPSLGLTQLVKLALSASAGANAEEINAAFVQKKAQMRAQMRRQKQKHDWVPVLSLAHSMGPGHNNCLHAGIGLALLLLPPNGRMMTFSSNAQWHQLINPDDFVSNVRYLFEVASAPINGLNANLEAVYKLAAEHKLATDGESLFVISDMEHDGIGIGDGVEGGVEGVKTRFWNAASTADYFNFNFYLWQRTAMPASSAKIDTSGSLL